MVEVAHVYEINFDNNRITGVYSTTIIALPDSPNLFDIEATINHHDGDTFYLSFDIPLPDSIPDIKFRLVPFNIINSYFTERQAWIKLIGNNKYAQLGRLTTDYLGYWDIPDSISGSYFRLSLQSIDSLASYNHVSIDGERDY